MSTLQISGFEGETVGSVPSGWTQGTPSWQDWDDSSGEFEVTDQDPIQGSKSLFYHDPIGGDIIGGYRGYSGQDAITMQWRTDGFSDERSNSGVRSVFMVEDGSANVWSYALGDTAPGSTVGDLDLAFTDDDAGFQNDDEVGTYKVASSVATKGTAYEVQFKDITTSLKMLIDGSVVHDTGTAYGGGSAFHVQNDDLRCLLDGAGIYSDLVYHQGSRVLLASATQDFVHEGVEREPVSDTGKSEFVAIEDDGVGYE